MMLGDGEFNNVVVSTLREARGLAPLIEEGIVKDVIFPLYLLVHNADEGKGTLWPASSSKHVTTARQTLRKSANTLNGRS